MTRCFVGLLLASSLWACSGGVSTSSGGFAGGTSGGIGNSSSTGGGLPNSSLEGDPNLVFVPAYQDQTPGAVYSDGGFGQLAVSIGLESCGGPTYVFALVGAVGGPALTIGDYPVGDGGSSTPPVDAGASLVAYESDGAALPAVDGFLFFNTLNPNNSIGNFSVDLALPDGGTSNLAGSFEVTDICETNNQ